jgi:hypothetical protein
MAGHYAETSAMSDEQHQGTPYDVARQGDAYIAALPFPVQIAFVYLQKTNRSHRGPTSSYPTTRHGDEQFSTFV